MREHETSSCVTLADVWVCVVAVDLTSVSCSQPKKKKSDLAKKADSSGSNSKNSNAGEAAVSCPSVLLTERCDARRSAVRGRRWDA